MVTSLEAEHGVAYVVHSYEDDADSHDLPPELADLLGNPLCVLEIGDFDAHVKEVDKAASEAESVYDCLLA